MNYKIEKNVAMPVTPTKNTYPFKDMQIGDSFLITKCTERDKVRVAAIQYRTRKDPMFKISMKKIEEGKWRVWRVPVEVKAVQNNLKKTA